MDKLKNTINMYSGLRKEIYVLAFGRVVTSMGSLIWPLLTLILKNKMQFTTTQIGQMMMILTILQLPMSLLGGKLADRFNKRNIILVFDCITVTCFIIAGLIPFGMPTLLIYFVGTLFANMEGPSYEALFTDLTSTEDRERAHSLNYLALNLGLVLSPMLGGFLFKDHLALCFVISGIATFSSTILIFFFVKNIQKEVSRVRHNVYEDDQHHSVFEIFKQRKILIFYILISSLGAILYAQFNFMMPLHLEGVFGVDGALKFGILTSINAFVVVSCTPLITRFFASIRDVDKILLGALLEYAVLASYIFITDQFWICCITMIVFTWGEIIHSIGNSPYLSRRIPATHRGRIFSMIMVVTSIATALGNLLFGSLMDIFMIQQVWMIVGLFGVICVIGWLVYRKKDKANFPLLYN